MNIRVDVGYTIKDGTEILFRSPVDCSAITGLIVYYPDMVGNETAKEFAFADAHGNNVGDIDHLFAENVVVKVILDVTAGMAFVQNADTNAYLEGRFNELDNVFVGSYGKVTVNDFVAAKNAGKMCFLEHSDGMLYTMAKANGSEAHFYSYDHANGVLKRASLYPRGSHALETIKFVKSINGIRPEDDGSITLDIGSGGGGGADGFSPIANVTQTSDGAVISITDKDGTTTATITNGKDGNPGADGAPGEPGKDYVLTEADKQEIAELAAELVDVPEGGGGSGGGSSESNLILRYVHSENKEIYPTALDLETGVFTCENHGLTTGDAAIVVCDYWFSFMPYELITTRWISLSYPIIRVVDENSFVLQKDNTDLTYPSANNTHVDVSKWHIEIAKPGNIIFDGFSANSIEVRLSGWVWGTNNYNLAVHAMRDGEQIKYLNGAENAMIVGAGNDSTVGLLVSGTLYFDNVVAECNAYVLRPPANEADYKYGQTYQTFVGFGNRCGGTVTEKLWPLAKHDGIDAILLCHNSYQKNPWSVGPLMLANGFTVEVYRHE